MGLYSAERVIGVAVSMVVLVLVIGALSANAQSVCNVSVSELMSCKASVTPPKPTPPSKQCCSAITHADLPCLCSYKNSAMLPAIGIDPKLAFQLPAKCKLAIPIPANCV